MEVLFGILAALAVAWLALGVTLLVARPHGGRLGELLRLLPDAVRLFRALIRNPDVPSTVKLRLWLLLAYLASPIDLVPDFIPILGYADDAVIAALVLRSVVRRAGPAKVRQHWGGTADGLEALLRAAGTSRG